MLKIIATIIDGIFPPRDTERLVSKITNHDIIKLLEPGWYIQIHFLASYKDKNVQALIKENKYHHNTKAARHLASWLEHWLQTRTDDIILISLPLGKKRLKERGYNQVSEILRAVPRHKNVTIREGVLLRTKETPTQTNLNKFERQLNLKDAFSCTLTKVPELEGHTIVLVDDVVTTGATLDAARTTLMSHLSPTTKVICLALAH